MWLFRFYISISYSLYYISVSWIICNKSLKQSQLRRRKISLLTSSTVARSNETKEKHLFCIISPGINPKNCFRLFSFFLSFFLFIGLKFYLSYFDAHSYVRKSLYSNTVACITVLIMTKIQFNWGCLIFFSAHRRKKSSEKRSK